MHTSWPWDELVALRSEFSTQASLAQYIGFVKDHYYKAKDFAAEARRAEDEQLLTEEQRQTLTLTAANGGAADSAADGAAPAASPASGASARKRSSLVTASISAQFREQARETVLLRALSSLSLSLSERISGTCCLALAR